MSDRPVHTDITLKNLSPVPALETYIRLCLYRAGIRGAVQVEVARSAAVGSDTYCVSMAADGACVVEERIGQLFEAVQAAVERLRAQMQQGDDGRPLAS